MIDFLTKTFRRNGSEPTYIRKELLHGKTIATVVMATCVFCIIYCYIAETNFCLFLFICVCAYVRVSRVPNRIGTPKLINGSHDKASERAALTKKNVV